MGARPFNTSQTRLSPCLDPYAKEPVVRTFRIDVDGTNAVDKAATKQAIIDHLNALAASMTGSCTLTVFIHDHGTGYSGSAVGSRRIA